MDTLNGLKRTHYCGTLRADDVGCEAVVCGWVQKQRDLGALIFVDLRDRSGILQLAFTENTDRAIFDKAFALRSEYVVAAKGIVRERAAKNPEIPTGDVELEVTDLRLLSKSETPPFEIVENSQTSELTRLKYRYLDLRRPDLQKNILMRHKIAKITRDYFDENGFIEIETPMLIRSTPEGARDFLVPSRIHKGSFYALPQSPQLYKQLSMVAGRPSARIYANRFGNVLCRYGRCVDARRRVYETRVQRGNRRGYRNAPPALNLSRGDEPLRLG